MLCEEPSIEQRKLLDEHLRLVIDENTRVNLTRIDTWKSGQLLHIEDSLVGLPEVNEAIEGSLLDMGTGGGFPGIPLAIMTNRSVVLADSVGKKTKALDGFIPQLGLQGRVSTFNGRLEDLGKEQPQSFAVVTARALSSLPSLLELASPLLVRGGRLVCYKAPSVEEELPHTIKIQAMLGMRFISKRDVVLSDKETHRSIVVFKKDGVPKVQLPRRVGMAQKKPL